MSKFPPAAHFIGGNKFDNLQIDIDASHALIPDNPMPARIETHKGFFKSKLKFYLDGFLQKSTISSILFNTGIRSGWFHTFLDYWINILGGRPLEYSDFHPLLHDYRKRQQKNSEYDWQNSNSHIKNWQEIESLYYILSLSRSLEIRRINSPKIFKYLKPDSISLEYGCSLAPFYSTYKRYFSHKKSRWVLADLPNFPFHYAKYIYRNDPVKFHTINSDNFSNPLPEGINYDFVVIVNVFEHLDDPIRFVKYLMPLLSKDAIIVFDYLISEGLGLDTPRALKDRTTCLKLIQDNFTILEGPIDPIKEEGLIIAKINK